MPKSCDEARAVLASRIARFCYLKTFVGGQEAVIEAEESLIDMAASQFRESLRSLGGDRGPDVEANLRKSIGEHIAARSPDPDALARMKTAAEGLDLSPLLPGD